MAGNHRTLDNLRDILAQNGARDERAWKIAQEIRAAGHYRWVGLYDIDTRHGVVVNIAWSGPAAPEYPIFPVTKGLTSRAIAAKKTVSVGDVSSDPDYLTALSGTRSEIIIPILCKDGEHAVGTIDVESERLNAFDSAAQKLLEECARVLEPLWCRQP